MTVQIKRENSQLYVRFDDHDDPIQCHWYAAEMIDALPDERGYNGWSNYETWAANLHLTNDQDLYRYARTFVNADSLKQAVTDDIYTLIEGQSTIDSRLAMMYQDLLIASLQSVNWYEVYDALHEGDEEE